MRSLFFITALSILSFSARAQDAATLRKKHFNLEAAVAISGYDPVAYFTQKNAAKGNKELALYHQGLTYYFSSPANKEAFKA
ncbi:MAG: hypothetical protein KTQ13_10330, partial [Ferruginibacter sp.]|nr:hypothetical protein [Ferruginibacter sp.]